MIRSLEFQAPHPLGREEKLEIAMMIHHAYTMKLPEKSPKYGVWGASGLAITSMYREGDRPHLHRDRNSRTWDPPGPHLLYHFIWLFVCILNHYP